MKIRVGMGEVTVTYPENDLVTTIGSCIAVCIYDFQKRIGGMAHIVLPKKRSFINQDRPCKFADIAVPTLINKMKIKGCERRNLKAKIAGGANMFPNLDQKILSIGQDNINAVKQILRKESIPLVAEDIGGIQGRRIEFEVSSMKMVVQRLKGEMKIL